MRFRKQFGADDGAGSAQGGAAAVAAPYPPGSAGGYGARRDGARTQTRGGAGHKYGAECGAVIDADFVVHRLEEAGTTLLALPGSGYAPGLRSSALEIVRDAAEAYGWSHERVRPAVPSAAKITRMDEAFGWLGLIPRESYVLRRIVGARALVSPMTGRHLYSWRRLGAVLGADHKAISRWHAQGIALIVRALGG